MVLLVSLVGLLIAAAGLARYIWLQRARIRSKPPENLPPATGPSGESDVETEL
jgi:hypothetical protein